MIVLALESFAIFAVPNIIDVLQSLISLCEPIATFCLPVMTLFLKPEVNEYLEKTKCSLPNTVE